MTRDNRAQAEAIGIDWIPAGFVCDDHGIWRGETRAVSYPADGNALCRQIEDRSFWFRHRNNCIAAALRRHPPAGALLDIGGGNGFVARDLAAGGRTVALLEPGEDGCRAARERGVAVVLCASLETAGIAAGSVPAVGLFDVLEHIEDDAAALIRVRELLRPGGLVYLTVPGLPALFSDDDRLAGHFRRYSLGRLRTLFEACGFELCASTFFFTLLTLPVLLLRTLPSLARIGLGRPLGQAHYQHLDRSGHGLERLMRWEISAIERGVRLPIGSSCLIVARKSA